MEKFVKELPLVRGEPFLLVINYKMDNARFIFRFNDEEIGMLTFPDQYLEFQDVTFNGDVSIVYMGFTKLGTHAIIKQES